MILECTPSRRRGALLQLPPIAALPESPHTPPLDSRQPPRKTRRTANPPPIMRLWIPGEETVVVELLIAMSLIAWEITAHPHEHASKNAMSALAPETRARPEPRKPIADWVQSAAPSNVVPIAKSERLQTARALSVIDFGAAQLEAAPGDTLDFDEFFNAYVAAAQASKMRAHAVEEFVEPFKKLCAEAGIRTRKRGSKLFLCDVKLAS